MTKINKLPFNVLLFITSLVILFTLNYVSTSSFLYDSYEYTVHYERLLFVSLAFVFIGILLFLIGINYPKIKNDRFTRRHIGIWFITSLIVSVFLLIQVFLRKSFVIPGFFQFIVQYDIMNLIASFSLLSGLYGIMLGYSLSKSN